MSSTARTWRWADSDPGGKPRQLAAPSASGCPTPSFKPDRLQIPPSTLLALKPVRAAAAWLLYDVTALLPHRDRAALSAWPTTIRPPPGFVPDQRQLRHAFAREGRQRKRFTISGTTAYTGSTSGAGRPARGQRPISAARAGLFVGPGAMLSGTGILGRRPSSSGHAHHGQFDRHPSRSTANLTFNGGSAYSGRSGRVGPASRHPTSAARQTLAGAR